MSMIPFWTEPELAETVVVILAGATPLTKVVWLNRMPVEGAVVLVGGTAVLVGGTDVFVGGTAVLVGGTLVLVGGTAVLVGGTAVLGGASTVTVPALLAHKSIEDQLAAKTPTATR